MKRHTRFWQYSRALVQNVFINYQFILFTFHLLLSLNSVFFLPFLCFVDVCLCILTCACGGCYYCCCAHHFDNNQVRQYRIVLGRRERTATLTADSIFFSSSSFFRWSAYAIAHARLLSKRTSLMIKHLFNQQSQ